MKKHGWQWLGAALVVALGACALATPVCASEVRVTGGRIAGTDQPDGSAIYLGIPYAAPPVGSLRWKAPAPIVPWLGVRDATKVPAPCLQHDEGWNKWEAASGSEDCLYLSVHTPKHRRSDRLPVMLWIHGGSNMAGSGSGYANESAVYTHGIVLVSIEYRLGIFGFLSSSALTAESSHHASGNYALLDQVAALQWVRDNIARFGGDPHNVTIAGQSAGGHDVSLLIISPLARGLFHKAIEQSGAVILGVTARSAATAEKIGARFSALVGVPEGSSGLASLRAMPGDALLVAQDKMMPEPGDPFGAWGQESVDGYFLTRAPIDVLGKSEQAHVPLIIGNNAREFSMGGNAEGVRQAITTGFGDKAPELLSLYGFKDQSDPPVDELLGDLPMQFISDVAFRCPASRMAVLQNQTGKSVWRYQFGLGWPGRNTPVEHSSELKYVSDPVPANATFASWPPLQAYWANFMHTGDPNGPGLPHWESLGKEANYIDFTPQGPQMGKNLRGDICGVINR